MNEALKEEASRLLQDGYDGIIGLRKKWGHVGPYLFSQSEELQDLVLEPRYPLAKFICQIQRKWPGKRLAAIVRGCDERFLKTLEERGVFKKDGFAFIGIVCSQEQAEACNCEKPVYNTRTCTGCWKCIEKCEQEAITRINVCPIVLPNERDLGLSKRKAIYIPFPQAVPAKYTRDADHCLKITDRLDCKGCLNVCDVKAIDDQAREEYEEREVGAIIIATGYDIFDARLKPEYGYGIYPNVITGLELERLAEAGGPTGGKIQINGKEPKNVVFIQCVGSRDKSVGVEYCSRVCCMYTTKQAYYIKSKLPDAKVTVCYIDIRAFGKGYEEFYERVQGYGVIYRRGVVSEIYKRGDKLIVRAEDTLLGEMYEEEADLVVLAVGLRPGKDTEELMTMLRISTGADGFFLERHPKLGAVESGVEGIYLAGCCQGPKDIADSVVQASAAAAMACITLSKVEREAVRS